MKLFALKDAADHVDSVLATLTCYEAEREYYIDMPPATDPWTVPFVLSSFAARGQWEIGPEWSRRWVESRIVPPNRQNLGEVLKVNGLDEYDDLALLEMTAGCSSQDSCYLEPLKPGDVPSWYTEREAHRVVEAAVLTGKRLLVAFRTGEGRVCAPSELVEANASLESVVANEAAFARVEVAAGGRGVRWGTVVRISDADLSRCGTPIPLSWDDIARIAPTLLVDTAEAAEILGCTRQNIHALTKRGLLESVKTGGKTTLFLRADVKSRLP